MGWAGPAQPIGPGSAQKVLGRFRPNYYYLLLGQKTGLGQDQPGPLTRLAGPEQVWPSTRNERGELFSPPSPACRTNVLHAEGNAGHGNNMRGKESLPGAGRRCLAMSLAVLWRRPVAVSWLTDGGSKQQRRCSVFSVFP